MKTKIAMVFAVLMAALAVSGFSYATWYSSVFINGNVKTGSVDMIISAFEVRNQTDYPADIVPAGVGTNTLTLDINKTYPGWHAFVWIQFKNTGTIPLRFYAFTITRTGGEDLMAYYSLGFCYDNGVDYSFNFGPHAFSSLTGWTYYDTDLELKLIPRSYLTLQPGDSHWNLVYLGLDSSLGGSQSKMMNVKFEFEAAQAFP
jgi:hypothetical protein